MKKFNLLFIIFIFFCIECKNNIYADNNIILFKDRYMNNNFNIIRRMDNLDNKNCIRLDTVSILNHQEMMKYIERQKKTMESDGVSVFLGQQHTKESLKFELEIIPLWLKMHNYKFPSPQNFHEKIKMIFNIDITKGCDNIEKYNDYYIFIRNEDEMFDLTEDDLIFSIKDRFIYKIDRERLFAEYSFSEKGYYFCISDKNFHYNNYLFNDSNASLTWLINNDIEFLEVLIREFGFDKNDKINKAVLNKNLKLFLKTPSRNKNVMINLFARKRCDNTVEIRKNLMKYISYSSSKQYETPLDMLTSYALSMISLENNGINNDFTLEERFKIAAYAGYFEILARERNNIDDPNSPNYTPKGWNPGSFLRNELGRNKAFLKAIKSNGYYGLPDFENMVDRILYQTEVDSEKYK